MGLARLNLAINEKTIQEFKDRCQKNGWVVTRVVEALIKAFNRGKVDEVLKEEWNPAMFAYPKSDESRDGLKDGNVK